MLISANCTYTGTTSLNGSITVSVGAASCQGAEWLIVSLSGEIFGTLSAPAGRFNVEKRSGW